MLMEASAFNKDIGSWDVSNGEDFVSISMNHPLYIDDSSQVTHDCFLCLVVYINRNSCSFKHHHLTRTLAVGTCPTVKTS